ncbi:hypothetical protein [Phytomonospora endophytica]|uniref:Uncharacterized protein n=1 Tax=Phytomonospora endophytica TaxID=714109 RepID=A0A841FP02_9ACTN|nr:hypothetical protein [Phytomonospora endophytica]MBB6036593.1 hypothetical protein [Phytomonospora endophytica]GIG65914.1 hypothetical protein Pen01_22090 [Phytomonospora endophytica]
MDGRWNGTRPDMPQRLGRWAGRLSEGGRSTKVVGLTGGGVAAVLVVAIVVSMLTSGGDEGEGAASTAAESVLTSAPSLAPTTTPPVSPSPSPSKTKKKPTTEPTQDDNGGGGEDEPEPEPTTKKPKGTVSTGPTSFDVWRTGDGKYAANWEWPVSDGGLRISGYVLRECGGKEIIRVNDATYAIEFNYPFIDCATVQAVNAAGEGAKSTGHVPNNP